jgi:hypothetical protein
MVGALSFCCKMRLWPLGNGIVVRFHLRSKLRAPEVVTQVWGDAI